MKSGKIKQEPAPIPKSIKSKFQVDVSEVNGRKIWRIAPKQNGSQQVVIYLHGGAYIYNMTRDYWKMVEQLLIHTGSTFVVLDYPLAPQAQWQAAYKFVDTVYAQLLTEHSPEHIIFLGDSAGAGLALGFTQWLRNEKKPLPQQIILLSPFLDITMSNLDIIPLQSKDKVLTIRGLQLAGQAYAGELDHKDYRVSPINGDLDGLPTISLFIGTHDLLLPDSRKFKEKMRAANRPFNYFEYPNMIHAWVIIVNLEEAKHALGQVSRLILNEWGTEPEKSGTAA
jgi:acetyl esterase/lipase